MADFLELVESIRAEESDAKSVFRNEGVRIVGSNSPEYLKGLVEATNLVADVLNGNRFAMFKFQEALTTSDFPIFFGDIIDRQILAAYQETPQSYQKWARVTDVADFRPVDRRWLGGGEGVLDKVPEMGEYKAVGRTEGHLTYRVEKYGKVFPISWETIINDDMSVLRDQPERFGKAARRTEQKFATSLLIDDTFFSSGNKNVKTSNPLSIDGLTAAMAGMSQGKVDDDGEPVLNTPAILLVPPALEVTANNVLNALEIVQGDPTSGYQMKVANWLANKLEIVVDYYLPIVGGSDANKTWYLMSDPTNSRGACEIGFLRGHRNPEVFLKSPNAVSVGGGLVGALDGDFDHDSIMYKVRHVLGGTLIDPRCAYKSVG